MSKRNQHISGSQVEQLEQDIADWEKNEVASFMDRQPESRDEYFTESRLPLERVYTALDLRDTPLKDLGLPGRYPFTRGPYPTMYRGRNWTMRQIAGFGTGPDTNARFRYLLAQGQTGLSVDFDMPTLMGYDSDHPKSRGEVGREGVAIDTIDDVEALFDGVDLTKISISMTINPTAWILYAMYVALAQKRGNDLNQLSGTIQADMVKEYIAQKEWIFPIRPAVRLCRDCIVYSAEHTKRYNPINISGYHVSEAGGTSVQEVAFSMAALILYVEEVVKTGLNVDQFGSRLSFFYCSQMDLFQEVAKFRAARRVFAKIMKDRFGATDPETMRLRFHAQTAALALTKPQYKVNVVRTAFQALAAVLGGCQSLHTNGMDEAFAIPTEEAMKIALRTQQVISEELNVTSVVDPLGGSYLVENLTTKIEQEVFRILDRVDELGGTVKCIEDGWFQKEIADSAYEDALMKSSGERIVVGVNKYVEEDEDLNIDIHPYDKETEQRQIANLERVRKERDNQKVAGLLEKLKHVAKDDSANIMPVTIELVGERASIGDIVEALKSVWGTYRETPTI